MTTAYRFAAFVVCLTTPSWAQGIITTFAGNGSLVSSGDNGPATSAGLGLPEGVAVDSAGNVYIAESLGGRIRKVNGATRVITHFAGGGVPGTIGDGGPATSATLFLTANSHIGLALDAANNLYITDSGNNRIRKVTASSGAISTVVGAGSLGTIGFAGDGGPATAALLNAPSGVAFDTAGNMYIADTNNHRIRKVDTNGTITTIAGKGAGAPMNDGGPAVDAGLFLPSDVAVDPAGNIYIADAGNRALRKITGGTITTVARGLLGGCSSATVPALSADIAGITGLAIDGAGNVYISSRNQNCIQLYRTDNTITGVAGGGLNLQGENVAATSVALGATWAVASDPTGNFYIADTSNAKIRRVSSPTPLAAPLITSVVNGANFLPAMAPNTWISVRGTNLAPKIAQWDGAIVNNILPTGLETVTVTVAGKLAYVQYVSPTQINILTPQDIPLGAVDVIVRNGGGSSAPFTITSTAYSPAFFLWPNNQPVATHTDFTWAVKNGTFPGTTTISAKPGEVVILWGTGFGPTSPAPPVGQLVPALSFATSTAPVVTLQGNSISVLGAALAPFYAGLFQVAIRVPDNLADADYTLSGNINGTAFLGNQVLLTVKR